MVGELVRAIGRRDVDLDDDKVRFVVQAQALDVFVLNLDLIVVAQIAGQRGQAERWEERVFDRPEERAGGLRQCRQDHLDLHRWSPSSKLPMATMEISRRRGPSSSTRNTRCHTPRWSRPPTTFRQAEVPSSRVWQWAWPFGRSSGARFTVRTLS